MIIKIDKSKIIFNKKIQELCCKPYYNHKNGCPNFAKKKGCPPNVQLINDVLDFNKDMFIVYTEFDIKSHVVKMRKKLPRWTERQLYCCLYWQPRARKIHKDELKKSMVKKIISCPEAYGVNVTNTMKNIGIKLEWPPKNIVRIVSLAGYNK